MSVFTAALSARGFAVLFGAVLVLSGCGSNKNNNDDDVLQNAASCGGIHFKSRPVVLLADGGDPAPNGDTSLTLVVDVPNTDVDSFKKLSDLPAPTPGPPEGWLESALKDFESKDKALADVLKASRPEDFQHVLQDRNGTPYSRGVVIQKTPRPDTRIYIGITCF